MSADEISVSSAWPIAIAAAVEGLRGGTSQMKHLVKDGFKATGVDTV